MTQPTRVLHRHSSRNRLRPYQRTLTRPDRHTPPPPQTPLSQHRTAVHHRTEAAAHLSQASKHTIILMQTSQNRATRTFMDYDSINQAMDGICALYERKLKELNPTIRNISYDISDLYNFVDGLADMSALVFEHSIQAYLPYDRQWIKRKTFDHLKRLASN